ncbi:hypothetical protein GCM10027275_15010 [Rhabdobacter roseus]|uniref:Collagen-like protein n=1 Tax=Rhabdobacter roseus TaxID=1655419 RepID=A0A840TJ55_9BACT|nr:collagen-like protein [Rhabdobacter roseus]MBB5283421.1 hypothetical protein [Rhabdobacter roseus]
MLRRLLTVALVAAMPLMYGCEGPQGEVGPEGPQGPQGTQGPEGEEGVAGAIQFTTGARQTDEDGDLGFSLDIPAEAASFVEKGVVLVYAKTQGFWFQVPGEIFFANGGFGRYTFAYRVSGGKFDVQLIQTATADTNPQRQFEDVRVVLVLALNSRLSADVDFKDYKQVQKAFNLPE